MKVAFIIGIMWTLVSIMVVWFNYRFHRHYTISKDQRFSPEVPVEMGNMRRAVG